MRGEFGYEKFAENCFKVWRKSPNNKNSYYLVGFVEKRSSPFFPRAQWISCQFSPKKILGFFDTRNEAALSIPMPGYLRCEYCNNHVHESVACKGHRYDVLCPACKDIGL